MSNSQKMNVSERLAQRLKESELGTLLDEDAVTDIASDAIKKAFFERRSEGYNAIKPPLIVEMAEASFKTAIDEAMKPIIEKLVADTEFNKLLFEAIMSSVASTAMGIGQYTFGRQPGWRTISRSTIFVKPLVSVSG